MKIKQNLDTFKNAQKLKGAITHWGIIFGFSSFNNNFIDRNKPYEANSNSLKKILSQISSI